MKDNWMIEEIRMMSSWENLNPEQSAYFKRMAEDAHVVECVSIKDVLSSEELKYIRKNLKPRKNECYRNATCFCELLSSSSSHRKVSYVEGFSEVGGVVRLEHAWCKVDGKYVDPTFELLLKHDPTKKGYLSLIEMSLPDLLRFQAETGYYGDTYRLQYLKTLRKE